MIGYIYKIHCNVTGKDYYGSSRDIKIRLNGHIQNHKQLRGDCTSEQVLEAGNWTHTIVEEVEYDGVDTTPLRIRETYYIDKFKCVNINRPYRTKEEEKEYQLWYRSRPEYNERRRERYSANPEPKKEKARAYHEANKETINARNAQRIQCGCGTEHARSSTTRHKRTKKHTDWEKSQENA
jgi:hypothetical protein